MSPEDVPALVPADLAAALRAAGAALLECADRVPAITDADALVRVDVLRRDLVDPVRRARVLTGAYRVAPQREEG